MFAPSLRRMSPEYLRFFSRLGHAEIVAQIRASTVPTSVDGNTGAKIRPVLSAISAANHHAIILQRIIHPRQPMGMFLSGTRPELLCATTATQS